MPLERRVSVRTVADRSTPFGRKLWRLGPLLDRILGIDAVHALCERTGAFGRDPVDFASHLLDGMGIRLHGGEALAERLPRTGPVIVVANHPHGAIEGVVMIRLLMALRGDVRIMANTALRVFQDLEPAFLFVNPLIPKHPSNLKGLRDSLRHLKDGGVLVVFPASRTSFYRDELGRITDGEWNRVVANLGRRTDAAVLPVRFCDHNSARFYRLGRIWYRFRLLMLARELVNKEGADITMAVGRPIAPRRLASLDEQTYVDTVRLHTYLQRPPDDAAAAGPAPTPTIAPAPLAASVPRDVLEAEIDALPAAQRVHEGRGCVVVWGRRAQFPGLVDEITRERERTFRLLDEGSGAAVDTDDFDDVSDHILVWDREARALLGAYRMGRREELTALGGSYLEQMFDFAPAFFASRPPALELGRSFVAPEYQRARHALDFLWRGVGGFLRAHPQYGTLYGTVSLTTQYDPVSVAMICDALIDAPGHVRPRRGLATVLPPDWDEYRARHRIDLARLDDLVGARESDGKGLPILVKHYAGLGARFHAVGIDPNFAATPGLLLSVDVASAPEAKRRRYLR